MLPKSFRDKAIPRPSAKKILVESGPGDAALQARVKELENLVEELYKEKMDVEIEVRNECALEMEAAQEALEDEYHQRVRTVLVFVDRG